MKLWSLGVEPLFWWKCDQELTTTLKKTRTKWGRIKLIKYMAASWCFVGFMQGPALNTHTKLQGMFHLSNSTQGFQYLFLTSSALKVLWVLLLKLYGYHYCLPWRNTKHSTYYGKFRHSQVIPTAHLSFYCW